MKYILLFISVLFLFSCEEEEDIAEQNLIEFLKGKVYQQDIPDSYYITSEGKGMLSLTYLFFSKKIQLLVVVGNNMRDGHIMKNKMTILKKKDVF